MTDVISDGRTKVAFVDTIANLAAPTVAELDAGLELQHVITPDGLIGFEATTAEVANDSLASTFDTKTIGRDSFSGTALRLKKQSGASDEAYTKLVKGASGYVVIRRDEPEGDAWAASDAVEVYPVTCGQTRFLPPEANTVRRYEVPTMITDAPELRAVVAAGA
ncbi:hypothetical protein [Micromonospora sp. NPDC047730]|uniref:phage tail tube protein n=1 Tax=Micromonospora sp. NPDC047730 TaxID=3364253 RepID=UPI003717CD55